MILETINNLAGASEGKAIEQGLKLILEYMDQRTGRHLKIESCKEAFTKQEFGRLLRREVDYLHVSAHGCKRSKINGKKLEKKDRYVLEIGRKEKSGKIIKRGEFVTPSEIKKIPVKATNIFVSACFSGHEDLAKAFFSDERKGIYLGSRKKISFDTAFLVALHFHRGCFLDQSITKGVDYVNKDRSLGRSGTYYLLRSPRDLT